MATIAEMTEKTATISPCGRYRYRLGRSWSTGECVNFVMLNPSTADADVDDPTIRRCIGFARSWGYGSLVVTNLYPYRATSPKDLFKAAERLGPGGRPDENRRHVCEAAKESAITVCAWGANANPDIAATTTGMLVTSTGRLPLAIRLTKGGVPSHPLYLPANLRPAPWLFNGGKKV